MPDAYEVSVRPVVAADRAAWLRMRDELWPGTPDEHAAETQRYFEAPVAGMDAVLLAVDADGRAVGFVELALRPCAEGCATSPVGYVEGWFVAADARRRGVGRALMRAAERWARAQGCAELASDTELENEGSASAHVSLGFEDLGVVRCFRKSLG